MEIARPGAGEAAEAGIDLLSIAKNPRGAPIRPFRLSRFLPLISQAQLCMTA